MKTFLWMLYSLLGRPEQWASGYLICMNCGERHVATWPIGCEPFQCPYCNDEGDEDGLCVPWDGIGFGEAQVLDHSDRHAD